MQSTVNLRLCTLSDFDATQRLIIDLKNCWRSNRHEAIRETSGEMVKVV